MSASNTDPEKKDLEHHIRIQRQIAFAAGVFQEDITVRTILESVAEGVVVIDNTGTILLVNARAELMFGYDRQDLIGRHHSVLIPEPIRELHEEHQRHFFEQPACRPMGQLLNLVGRRRDGSVFPLEISLGVINTINGILVLALVDDISMRKQAEQALKQSEELFRVQVGCIQDYAIYMLNPEGNIMSWNPGAEHLNGYRTEEILGRHFSCLYPEEERGAGTPGETLNRAAAAGTFATEGWRVRKDGTRFWADVMITSLHDDDGNVRGFSEVSRDITERKKAEDALRLSEARYRALYTDNPTMVVTIDRELNMLSLNPSCLRQLRYAVEELSGESVLKLFHHADHAGVLEQLEKCFQNPYQVYHWQFRKVAKDGSVLWVEEIAQAVYDLNNQLNVLIVCQDVTEREELLLQLEAVLDSINEAVIISDLQCNIVTLNKAAMALNGYESPEQACRPLREYQDVFDVLDLEGRQLPLEEWPLARAVRGEKFVDYEIQLRQKDTGRVTMQSISGGPVLNKAGEPILAVSTSRDITERKRMELELQQSKELLEQRVAERTEELSATIARLQAETLQREQTMHELRDTEQMLIHQGRMAAMGEMIGFIAHQWRQPLNTLGLIVQELPIFFKRGEITQEYLDASALKARELIAHMSRTIDDFRNFFRTEKQKVLFRVRDQVEQVLTLVSASFKEKQTAIDVVIDDDAELEGYPNEFSQAILNILVNINDIFAERKIAEPRIRIRIFREHGRCVITISDNAGGIAEDIIGKVFEAYFTTKGPEKGTGLGLYMSKTIIEKNMGGRLSVRNSVEGAEFKIEV